MSDEPRIIFDKRSGGIAIPLGPTGVKKMNYYVMKAMSAYRCIREDELEDRILDGWEVIHGPTTLEDAKESCIEELEMQKICADEEIDAATKYAGAPYPKLR